VADLAQVVQVRTRREVCVHAGSRLAGFQGQRKKYLMTFIGHVLDAPIPAEAASQALILLGAGR